MALTIGRLGPLPHKLPFAMPRAQRVAIAIASHPATRIAAYAAVGAAGALILLEVLPLLADHVGLAALRDAAEQTSGSTGTTGTGAAGAGVGAGGGAVGSGTGNSGTPPRPPTTPPRYDGPPPPDNVGNYTPEQRQEWHEQWQDLLQKRQANAPPAPPPPSNTKVITRRILYSPSTHPMNK